ncbi:hypothetical protein QYM36_009378 [Artemia franciscana]|uniref:Uncharacterized protein n=1 Tax=Artemia franciscana TaxID=6661 RepID=A0AA88HTG9_ARTSF|nr:hypothetical protein QYM36_009378 [Artemia franciscana]
MGVRLFIDPADLNKAISHSYNPNPTFEDAIMEQSSTNYFSKLDAISGYLSLTLSESASDFTTFIIIYRIYHCKQYLFGLISPQDEFQQVMEETFQGLEGLEKL